MGEYVIAAYRPKKGKAKGLLAEVKKHLPTLRREGLVTKAPTVALRAKDGTILEIFEWKSAKAVEKAHHSPAVLAMWGRFSKVCDFVTLASLEESKSPFCHFERVRI